MFVSGRGPELMMMNTRNQLHNSTEIMSRHQTQPSSYSDTRYSDTSGPAHIINNTFLVFLIQFKEYTLIANASKCRLSKSCALK